MEITRVDKEEFYFSKGNMSSHWDWRPPQIPVQALAHAPASKKLKQLRAQLCARVRTEFQSRRLEDVSLAQRCLQDAKLSRVGRPGPCFCRSPTYARASAGQPSQKQLVGMGG